MSDARPNSGASLGKESPSKRDTDGPEESLSDSDTGPHEAKRLEDQITNNKLKQLQNIFKVADEDGGGGLDMDEFRIAMRKAMGDHLTDHDLDSMFMKVDTNCDGTVDWDEYLSYMLLEYREKDAMNFQQQHKPFPAFPYIVPNMSKYQRHHDNMIKAMHVPSITKYHNSLYTVCADKTLGRIFTVTKTGLINVWTQDLKFVRSHNVEHMKQQSATNLGVWVTDAVYMANLNMMAVALTAGCIIFYDLTANHFNPVLAFTELEICVTCMCYSYKDHDPSDAILVWGDARGTVCTLKIEGCSNICFFQPSINKSFKPTIPFKELYGGSFCGVQAYRLPYIHDDFVLKIKYYPSLSYFMSCSRGEKTSLYMGDPQGKRHSMFKVSKGVFDFDYSERNNTIVTGGKDCIVRVWNPYVVSKPVMLLQGHKTAVLYVVINENKEHVITISEEKEIHIYDLNTQTCIQSVFKKWIQLGPRPISAICFNPYRQALILATNQLAMFEHKEKEMFSVSLVSHDCQVNNVLYNSLFNQVVSGTFDSLIAVWDVNTGEKTIQFYAHKTKNVVGEVIHVELTTMRFDPTLRRLITAARDGIVRVWNFNNGALLRELESFDDCEVTGIVCPSHRIMVAGWSQVIRVYMDTKDEQEETAVEWSHQHKDDINTLAYCPPSTVVSGSHDGHILIWSLETGHVTLRLNANVSRYPLSHVTGGPCTTEEKKKPSVLMHLPEDHSYAPSKLHHTSLLDKLVLPPESLGEEHGSESKLSQSTEELSNWLSYNTRRTSVAAGIPLADKQRRLSVLAPNAAASSLPFRRGGATLNSLQTMQEEDSDSNQSSNNNRTNRKANQRILLEPKLLKSKHFKGGVSRHSHKKSPYTLNAIARESNQRKPSRKSFDDKSMWSDDNSASEEEMISSDDDTASRNENNCATWDNENNNHHDSEEETLPGIGKRKWSRRISCSTRERYVENYKEQPARFAHLAQRKKPPGRIFKGTDSWVPDGQMTDETQREYDKYLLKNEASVVKIIFLEKRVSDPMTATLVCANTGGWIRFWSIDHEGGLMGQFNAAHIAGQSCGCMCTDDDNNILITADSHGYIKVWDISEYCINKQKMGKLTLKERREKAKCNSKYPLLKEEEKLRRRAGTQSKFFPPHSCTNPKETWQAPALLNSFRGHLQPIMDVCYVCGQEKFVTASVDQSIRLWTIFGEFLGAFGQEVPWSPKPVVLHPVASKISEIRPGIPPKKKSRFHPVARKLPSDVRRVASATTLRVLFGGKRPHWKLAKNILLVWVPLLAAARQKADELKAISDQIQQSGLEGSFDSQAKTTFTTTSEILGKSFKSKRKHQQFPPLPKVRTFQTQCDAYCSLPYYDLAAVETNLKPPPIVQEIQERQRLLMRTTKKGFKEVVKRNQAIKVFRPKNVLPSASKPSLVKVNRAMSLQKGFLPPIN